MRRTPLKRFSELRRTALKPISDRRTTQMLKRAADRGAVFVRDGLLCRLDPRSTYFPTRYHWATFGECFGPLTPHHLKKASQGGKFEMTNLVTLCARHNDWVEDYPDLAHEVGLVIRRGET